MGSPICVSFIDDDKRHYLVLKRIVGEGSCALGELTENFRSEINDKDWATFIQLFERLEFFRQPSVKDASDDLIASDQYTLDVFHNNQYHYVQRYDPFYSPVYSRLIVPSPTEERETFLADFGIFCLFMVNTARNTPKESSSVVSPI